MGMCENKHLYQARLYGYSCSLFHLFLFWESRGKCNVRNTENCCFYVAWSHPHQTWIHQNPIETGYAILYVYIQRSLLVLEYVDYFAWKIHDKCKIYGNHCWHFHSQDWHNVSRGTEKHACGYDVYQMTYIWYSVNVQ